MDKVSPLLVAAYCSEEHKKYAPKEALENTTFINEERMSELIKEFDEDTGKYRERMLGQEWGNIYLVRSDYYLGGGIVSLCEQERVLTLTHETKEGLEGLAKTLDIPLPVKIEPMEDNKIEDLLEKLEEDE